MAHYVIGDVHGHYAVLKRLLELVRFDPNVDYLYFVGDLINGGPQNVEIIQFIMDLGDHGEMTLGNHDISAIANFYGARKRSSKSKIVDLLEHPDAETLFQWLRCRPLAYMLPNGSFMAHAGISWSWSVRDALKAAKSSEMQLRADDPVDFLRSLFELPAPTLWKDCHTQLQRDIFTIDTLTRQRVVHTKDGSLEFEFKSTLRDMPSGLTPWFYYKNKLKKGDQIDARKETDVPIFFGHWSALGLLRYRNVTCLDSGVRWGGALTAYRLEDGEIFQAK